MLRYNLISLRPIVYDSFRKLTFLNLHLFQRTSNQQYNTNYMTNIKRM